MPLTPARLYVIATPLGNPGDISSRAVFILQNATLVLAEDTRRATWLFNEAGITVKKLLSFHEHNEGERLSLALSTLRSGGSVALISDAGTPLLADPGYSLVRECRKHGIPVSPVPGPCAPACALSVAGIPPIPFSFLGFLPRDESGIAKLFRSFSEVPGTLVFFERKDRLKSSLEIIWKILGQREMAICREMTKAHEEFIFLQLADFNALPDDLLGEMTVVIGPAEKEARTQENNVRALLAELNLLRLKPREIAREAAKKCAGWTGAEIYDLLLSMKNIDMPQAQHASTPPQRGHVK